MAKEIKKINPAKESPPKKGTTHIDIKTETEINKIRYENLIEQFNKLCLQNNKVCAVYLSFTVSGEPLVVSFGASREIQKRAQFLSEKIADMVPTWMEAYEIPKMDLPIKKVDA